MSVFRSPDLSPTFAYPGLTRIGASAVDTCASDLDDTVLATTPIEVASLEIVFSTNYGREFPTDTFYSKWNGRGGMFGIIADELGLGIPGEVLKKQVRSHFNDLTEGGIPYVPGAEDFLGRCNERGIRVAIATSTDREGMYLKAERSNLYPYISAWASGYEVARGKPEPDVFNLALWRLNAKPNRSFGIGDTEYDMVGLAKAGVPVRVLVTGERGLVERNTRATVIVRTPGDLSASFFDSIQRW